MNTQSSLPAGGGCSSHELLAIRNAAANEIVKQSIKSSEAPTSWRYIDFVTEDRFLHEVGDDESITAEMSAESVAEYALEQILKRSPMELFG